MNRNHSPKVDEIDRKLSDPIQTFISEAVKGLPDEQLSMAWRSELNDKLRLVRPVSKASALLSFVWKPTAGLAMAGCLALAFVMLNSSGPVAKQGSNLEASLVSAHRDAMTARDVAGEGIGIAELRETTQGSFEETWTEVDLGSL